MLCNYTAWRTGLISGIRGTETERFKLRSVRSAERKLRVRKLRDCSKLNKQQVLFYRLKGNHSPKLNDTKVTQTGTWVSLFLHSSPSQGWR